MPQGAHTGRLDGYTPTRREPDGVSGKFVVFLRTGCTLHLRRNRER